MTSNELVLAVYEDDPDGFNSAEVAASWLGYRGCGTSAHTQLKWRSCHLVNLPLLHIHDSDYVLRWKKKSGFNYF